MNNSTQINSSNDTRCSEAVSVLFTTAMAVITFGGLIGNLLVFITVYRNPNLRTSTNTSIRQYGFWFSCKSHNLATVPHWWDNHKQRKSNSRSSGHTWMQSRSVCQISVQYSIHSKPGVDRCREIHRHGVSLKSHTAVKKDKNKSDVCSMVHSRGLFGTNVLFPQSWRRWGGNILQIYMGRHFGACNLPHGCAHHANYCTVNYYSHLVFSYHACFKTTA